VNFCLHRLRHTAAPVVELNSYLADMEMLGIEKQRIKNFSDEVQSQQISNLFFLPGVNAGDTDFIALLDQAFWFCNLPFFRTGCKYTNANLILSRSSGNGSKLC
jgi:hypothetical protein